MKNVYNILSIGIAAMVLASCAKDETRVVALAADTATPPSLTVEYPGTAGSSGTIVVDDPDNEDFVAVLNWTNANFGRDIVVEYMLEISSQGLLTSSMDTLSLGSGVTSRTLKRSELNRWATETGLLSPAWETYLDLRIGASVALSNSPVIDYPDMVYSNTVTIPVVPYVGEVNPDFGTPALYMIGEEFGAWYWESPDVVTMVPASETSNEFWCIRYLTVGNGFKWSPVRDWVGDFYQLTNWMGQSMEYITFVEGNVEVLQSGLYLIYVNLDWSCILIEPAQVYGIGPAFEGEEDYPTEEPDNLFSVTGMVMSYEGLPYEGRLRMYARSPNMSLATAYPDWWRREFTILDGRIAYRANFGEMTTYGQPAAGDNVVLRFNTRQGTINSPQ